MSALEETMREAFERFATNSPMGSFCVTPDTRPGRAGGYWSSHTQLMWDSWKAAWSAALDAGRSQPVAPTVTDDMMRQALIALGWTPPDATPFAYVPAWVPARLDKYNHVTGHIAKNVGNKREQYIAIYVKEPQ